MNMPVGLVPPVEGKATLTAYLEAGQKPREAWRIGTEHEKFGYDLNTLRPIPYDGLAGIQAVLESLAERFGWRRVIENDNVVELKLGGQSITLEPGGQLELSGAPLQTLHETCTEVNDYLRQVKAVAEDLGVGFFGAGFQPKWTLPDIPRMPKARYHLMESYMPLVGTRGLDMMFRTATVQVNLDYGSESDMVKKFRVALALQPVATALFANSPFIEGRPSGYLSTRAATWLDTDPARTGVPEFVFEDGMGYERYTDWAIDVPMYFVSRGGKQINVGGQTFRDFLEGHLVVLPGERPSLADWEQHLGTLFPEVRMKRFLEMRGADAGEWERVCALPSLWVGLLYDSTSLDGAWDLVKHWSAEDRTRLASEVPRKALGAAVPAGGPGPTVGDLATIVVELAEEGLRRRSRLGPQGSTESRYLEAIHSVLDSGRTPAEELLALYHGRWNGSVDPLFTEFAH